MRALKIWLVDTNVIIDVLHGDTVHGHTSLTALETLSITSELTINPVIYAELAAFIEQKERLDQLVPADLFHREAIPDEAAFLAGLAFRRYKQQAGVKPRMLADFLIGAHATVQGYGLVTRDRGYKDYFQVECYDPSLEGRE